MRYVPFNERHGGLSEEARQAIIEHRRTMKDVRQWQAANRERIDADWAEAESLNPVMSAEQHISSLRDRDPERWQQLQREWSNDLR